MLRKFGARIIERDRAEETKCSKKPQRTSIMRVVSNDVSFVYSITRAMNRDLRFIRAGRPDRRKIRYRGASAQVLSPKEGEKHRVTFFSRSYGAPFIKSTARCDGGPTTLFSARLKVDIVLHRM